jgi:phosphoserine phosphatase
MGHVLVLIAASDSGAIDAALVESIRRAVRSEPNWLSPREAIEFSIPAGDAPVAVTEIVANRPIDMGIVPKQGRRKRLLLADMDSTMIAQECIDELGALAGAGDRIREITARAMRGELDFEGALKERVALMKGLPRDAISRVLRDRITLTPGGRVLVHTMRAHGAHTALVSGGFVEFTADVGTRLGFHEHRANEFIWRGDVMTGRVKEPILGRDAKLAALYDLCGRLGISAADALAVGDGANDIPMLAAAGLGVALHAKPKVREAVFVRVDHGDLTALLFLQGYRREEFMETVA